jgi:hypothetical protein
LGIALPFILTVGGWIVGVPLQKTLSAYYHATSTAPDCANLPPVLPAGTLRDEFVGVLIAVGVCLYLYKGFSKAENYTLNLAGVFAVAVALIPASICPGASLITAHAIVAVLFFLCIAYVGVFRADDTLYLIEDENRKNKYRRWYETLGAVMVVSPIAAIIVNFLVKPSVGQSIVILLAEAFGVWAFGLYWTVKSHELRQTSAERRALEGGVVRVTRQRRALPEEAHIIPI